VDFLTAYQNAAYAKRYRDRIEALRSAETKASPGSTVVTEAAAKNLFKLMAIKDEYEVARLYTDGSFARQLATQFQGYDRLEFHLAPPILGRRDADGKPIRVGGKTGTGDHRFQTVGADGEVKNSRVMNRAATFAFYLGDRFYGVVTAFVPGAKAANYDFTSALPVQILKELQPVLQPLISGVEAVPGRCAGIGRSGG